MCLNNQDTSFHYDFETDAERWIAKNNERNVEVPTSISSDWCTSGSNSLKAETILADPGDGNVSNMLSSILKLWI